MKGILNFARLVLVLGALIIPGVAAAITLGVQPPTLTFLVAALALTVLVFSRRKPQ